MDLDADVVVTSGLRRADELLTSGLVHVVDVDISYFYSIPHQRLMELVRERVTDIRVLSR